MTKTTLLLATLLVLPAAFAQSPPSVAARPSAQPPQEVDPKTGYPAPALTKFSLDFPGGTPKQLVTAIEKAMSRPLNAIIPPEHADVKLPPLKMSNIDVRQLFQALEFASRKTETYMTGNTQYAGGLRSNPVYQQMVTTYGFSTQGPATDDSIWYFFVEKPASPPPQIQSPVRVCRYFPLALYLDQGHTVDDITTAIQTGWKMLGDEDTPKISFHKETKLLIAVGDPGKLDTIEAVLQALKTTSSGIDPMTGLPAPPPNIPQRTLKMPQVAPSATQGNPSPPKP